MTATPDAAPEAPAPRRRSFTEALAVYLQPRVLVMMLLGFSGGVPIVLVGSTLQAWMTQSNVDIQTIGLFAAVAVPYNIKFLWAPMVDALDVPLLSRLLGRRRSWLLFSQILLTATITLLGLSNPTVSAFVVAIGALAVATASATQDIVIDAFRVESLPENEQAAGLASYVAAYRIASLAAGAGALLLVALLQRSLGLDSQSAWTACYAVMAALILVGIVGTLLAREPHRLPVAESDHEPATLHNPVQRALRTAIDSFGDFLSRRLALGALAFVVLFKLADALSFALLTPFLLGLGFSLPELGTIRNIIGFVAALLGGFVGGVIARAFSLSVSLWIGLILQTVMILAFCGQVIAGRNVTILGLTTTIEFFFDAIGTVIFVAYLSALCQNPLYTATQFALLTALAALGRNVFSLVSGYVVHATDWFWYFIICASSALPALLLLAWLQQRGHFKELDQKPQIP